MNGARRAVFALAIAVLAVGCSSGGSQSTSKTTPLTVVHQVRGWGVELDRNRLGDHYPSLSVTNGSSSQALTPFAWDWLGTKQTPQTVNWAAEAPKLTAPDAGGVFRVRVGLPLAPVTAHVAVYDQVDPTTGIPHTKPSIDVTCPDAGSGCRVHHDGAATELEIPVPKGFTAHSGYGVVSLRWTFTPHFPKNGGTSTEDNVWSVAAPFRV